MGVYLNLKKSIQRDLVTFSLTNLTDYQSNSTFPAPVTTDIGKTIYRSDLDELFQLQQNQTELGLQWVGINYDFFFIDFDDNAQIQELPNNHLVGTKAIGVTVDEHFVEMGLLVGLSIFGDTNFKKHDVVLDAMFTRYLPTKKIPVYNQAGGALTGSFIVQNGCEVMPMAKADQRPVQFMSINLSTDCTVDLR